MLCLVRGWLGQKPKWEYVKRHSLRSEKVSVSNSPKGKITFLFPSPWSVSASSPCLLPPSPPLLHLSLSSLSVTTLYLSLSCPIFLGFLLLHLCQLLYVFLPNHCAYIILTKIHHSVLFFNFINQGNSTVFQRWYHLLLCSVRRQKFGVVLYQPLVQEVYLFIYLYFKGSGMRKI